MDESYRLIFKENAKENNAGFSGAEAENFDPEFNEYYKDNHEAFDPSKPLMQETRVD